MDTFELNHRLKRLRVIVSMAALACNGEPTGASTDSGNSSGTSEASAQACGDGKPSPGVYCFEQHDVPSIVGPAVVAGAEFVANEPPRLAVFSPVTSATIVRWEDGSPVTNHDLPAMFATGGVRAYAFDVQGTQEPELIFTHSKGASFAPNESGTWLQEWLPLGFPESAFDEPGRIFPFDLGGDGQVDYIKGRANASNYGRGRWAT